MYSTTSSCDELIDYDSFCFDFKKNKVATCMRFLPSSNESRMVFGRKRHSVRCLLFLWSCVLIDFSSSFLATPNNKKAPLLLLRSSVPVTVSSRQQQQHRYKKWTEQPLLKKSGGILYKTSTFSKDECSAIRSELGSLLARSGLHEETTSSVAKKRLGASLPADSATQRVLRDGSLRRLVQKATGGEDYELCTEIPVEVRVYGEAGAGMAWHVDDVLYDPPQIEVVWTLENDSDCVTMWEEESSNNIRSVETEKNSSLLLLAGGPSHCVTDLKRGKRVILKCAYKRRDAVFRGDIDHRGGQFGPKKKQQKKKKKGKKR